MTDLKERVVQALQQAKAQMGRGYQPRIAKLLDVSQPTVSQWARPAETVPETHRLNDLARACRVNPHWLTTGEGPMEMGPFLADPPPQNIGAAEHVPTATAGGALADIPVYGAAECGDDGRFEMNGSVVDYIPRPQGLRNALSVYVIYAVGESMMPRFEPGDPIFVHPDRPPSTGSDVVLQLVGEPPGAGDQYFLKRLVRRLADRVVVHQFNPARDFEIPAHRIKAMHRVLTPAEIHGI